MWLEYEYHKLYPVLQFLPTKGIGENMQDELEFPDKQDPAMPETALSGVYPS